MRRREFIAALGGAVCVLPMRALAQTARVPVVGYLGFSSPEGDRPFLDALRQGLGERGLTVGQNIRIEARFAGGDIGKVDALIRELSDLKVDVFIAPGPAAARALRRATQTPIVALQLMLEQFERDLYASIAKPGGNVTGFSSLGEGLSAKRIDLVRQALPGLRSIGILHNGSDPNFREWGMITEKDARAQGLEVMRRAVTSTSLTELDAHFAALKAAEVKALIVTHDFLMSALREPINRSAMAAGIAAVGEHRDIASVGALLSYGPDVLDLFRRAGGYVDQILKGASPADLPIQLPARYEFVINLKTAKALGLTIPPSLLARADEVIE